ncbi:hypothetical protein C5167_008998 [Papaver somniferum]|uniref:Uncharacterized protein n=1 Tax=Papaver somniferum TaxID=3469 RepID=A0A4Y7K043_PAPSO|nr:hypothetical protein C5167_008998 [Papaver somniferum]
MSMFFFNNSIMLSFSTCERSFPTKVVLGLSSVPRFISSKSSTTSFRIPDLGFQGDLVFNTRKATFVLIGPASTLRVISPIGEVLEPLKPIIAELLSQRSFFSELHIFCYLERCLQQVLWWNPSIFHATSALGTVDGSASVMVEQ